jgi:uncharacterized protein YuzE
MKMKYDPDADALYIKVKNDKVNHTKEIDSNTVVDFNKEGEMIGLEILFVKERNPNFLKELDEYFVSV